MISERAAIVHDWFQGLHGAERVVDVMRSDLFAPDSEPAIYTFHAAHELLPPELSRAIVRESRVARLPGIRQRGHDPGRWRYLLPYMPTYFRRLDLRAYDLVISSSHAFAANVSVRPGALHVCYCHTPMRYAWLPQTDPGRAGHLDKLGLHAFRAWLRRIDLEASKRPHSYVANSDAVRKRIRSFYGRDAPVIHPPVEVAEFDPSAEKEPGRFLWVHRLVSYKRPELVAEAFRDLPYRLTMVGVGPLEARLRRMLPSNVELRGWVDRSELVRLFAQSSGFVHMAEEDFGMTMVEALASGTPVVALDRGGARDIVRHGLDGIHVRTAAIESIRRGVRETAERTWDPRVLAERAAGFDRATFVARFAAHVESLRGP